MYGMIYIDNISFLSLVDVQLKNISCKFLFFIQYLIYLDSNYSMLFLIYFVKSPKDDVNLVKTRYKNMRQFLEFILKKPLNLHEYTCYA